MTYEEGPSRSGSGGVAERQPIYRAIRDAIRRDIESRYYSPGERLPPDAELATRFGASRLTVIRALRELEGDGVVRRRAGSGTFVRSLADSGSRVFGILMPDLTDGEVFDPISHGIARYAEADHQRVLWGDSAATGRDKEEQAEELCRYFVSHKVAGVFFAPVEFTANQDAVNQRIAAELNRAGIPIVLVDRCICPYPDRSPYDLVGIDNRRAGCRMTRHLLAAGCRRVAYACRPGSAPTVAARCAGYHEALWLAGAGEPVIFEADPSDGDVLQLFMDVHSPDGIVCANDLTAAKLMHNLLKLGFRIPEDVRMVGINDVKYARFLPVPLTTLRQPCQQIGAAALRTMLERIERPQAPARDVLLDCEMVVRQSCGTTH